MTSDDAVITFRVPAAVKGRWVRESRAAGQRLTDWLVARIEAQPMTRIITLAIPADLTYADLRLVREPSGDVSFDQAVLLRVAQASGLGEQDLTEDVIGELLTGWYRVHRAAGGARDAVHEDLIEEVELEDRHGGGVSHAPGRA